MLKLAATRKEATIVADQWGCPTTASDLAHAIAKIAPLLLQADTRWGTYQLAGESETTWYGFAEAIFAELAKRGLRRPVNQAISTAEFLPRPARRPANSGLSSAAFRRAFGRRLPRFEAAMPRVLDKTLAEDAHEKGGMHA
jgi:dTDP-4-dehydrorhamnose reductase